MKTGKRDRIPTGISKLDQFIQGGYIKNSINLIIGSSGSGKTIFSTQFIMEGIKKGEKGLYITFEEKKQEFYANMLEFGWDLEKLEKDGKFFFLEYTPEKVRTMLEEGGGTIENIMITKKISRIVIDSITSFELLFEDKLKRREASLSLFSMLRKWDCTSLLTCEDDSSEEASIVEVESDSIISIYSKGQSGKKRRYLEIIKMRGTAHTEHIHEYRIKNGIELLSSKIKN